jgi:hypothetical protein
MFMPPFRDGLARNDCDSVTSLDEIDRDASFVRASEVRLAALAPASPAYVLLLSRLRQPIMERIEPPYVDPVKSREVNLTYHARC